MQTSPEAFLEPPVVSWLRPWARTHLKKVILPHSSGWWDVRQIPTSSQLSNLTVFGRTLLPAVLTLLFCIYVLFFNKLVLSTFSSSASSFWTLPDHNTSFWRNLSSYLKMKLFDSKNGFSYLRTMKEQESEISARLVPKHIIKKKYLTRQHSLWREYQCAMCTDKSRASLYAER